jgi:hypothetical protein
MGEAAGLGRGIGRPGLVAQLVAEGEGGPDDRAQGLSRRTAILILLRLA